MSRQDLLEELASLASSSFAETYPRGLFLPVDAHQKAFSPNVSVIVGVKGSGKSSLFQKMLASSKGEDPRPQYFIDAFSSSAAHPSPLDLDQIAKEAQLEELRGFWRIHLVRRLAATLPEGLMPKLGTQAQEAIAAPPVEWRAVPQSAHLELAQALDELDRRLETRKASIHCAYDHLDLSSSVDWSFRTQWLVALLAFWIHLTYRLSNLCPKIFLPDDLFKASQREVPDAGKMSGNVFPLDWSEVDLYRLVLLHLAAQPGLRQWLMKHVPGLPLKETSDGLIPGYLNDERLKELLLALTGKEVIGTAYTKVYVYRWILQNIRDGHGKIVPRTILNLFGLAAQEAMKRPPTEDSSLLDTADLVAALAETSRRRVEELAEAQPNAKALLNRLAGTTMLMPLSEARELLGSNSAVEELVELGLLQHRFDEQVDVPDLYRHGFGIQRKGGAAKRR